MTKIKQNSAIPNKMQSRQARLCASPAAARRSHQAKAAPSWPANKVHIMAEVPKRIPDQDRHPEQSGDLSIERESPEMLKYR
jgi:hypothetical protein